MTHDRHTIEPHERLQRARAVLRPATIALVVLVAVAALVLYNRASAAPTRTKNASVTIAQGGTAAAPTTSPTSPIPRALDGRAGREVTVLAVVGPPEGPHCQHMHALGDTLVYRLVGDWPRQISAAEPGARVAPWWWLTGHTVPVEDTADHDHASPPPPGCDHAPVFSVDHAESLTDFLTRLLHAVVAPALTWAPLATASRPL